LQHELRIAEEKVKYQDWSKGREVSALHSRHNREMADLEEPLRSKRQQIDGHNCRTSDLWEDLHRQVKEREEELEICKAGIHQVLLAVKFSTVGSG
jgi:hypothetical protein